MERQRTIWKTTNSLKRGMQLVLHSCSLTIRGNNMPIHHYSHSDSQLVYWEPERNAHSEWPKLYCLRTCWVCKHVHWNHVHCLAQTASCLPVLGTWNRVLCLLHNTVLRSFSWRLMHNHNVHSISYLLRLTIRNGLQAVGMENIEFLKRENEFKQRI